MRTALVPRASTRHVAVFIGADHHAAHPALGRLRALLEQIESDSEFRISRLQDFFAAAAPRPWACRSSAASCAGRTVTPGPCRASMRRAPRSSGDTPSPSWPCARVAEPLAALALATRGGDRRAAARPCLASTAPESVSRFDRRHHQRSRWLAGSSSAGRRSNDWRPRSPAPVSMSWPATSPTAPGPKPEGTAPRLVLWNPVPRRRRSVVVADLSWFRRDVLIGPPGDRLSRVGPGYHPFHLLGPSG